MRRRIAAALVVMAVAFGVMMKPTGQSWGWGGEGPTVTSHP